MGTKYNPSVVRNGLLICVDTANISSYSGTGITARGLVSGIGATLVNGIGFSSSNSGTFILDGSNDYINGDTTSFDLTGDLSAEIWFNLSATAAVVPEPAKKSATISPSFEKVLIIFSRRVWCF